jgi:hypothetical protein
VVLPSDGHLPASVSLSRHCCSRVDCKQCLCRYLAFPPQVRQIVQLPGLHAPSFPALQAHIKQALDLGQFRFLLTGGLSTSEPPPNPSSWLSDLKWAEMVRLNEAFEVGVPRSMRYPPPPPVTRQQACMAYWQPVALVTSKPAQHVAQ